MGRKLRQMALEATPDKLGLAPEKGEPFAAFMETGYPMACVTLSMIGEGSTSLYFSNGGGMIGGGEHASVKAETLAFLKLSRQFLSQMPATTDFSFPSPGVTRFILKTPEGFFASEALEADLAQGKSNLSPLFLQGQNVITKFREAAEAKKASG